MRPLTQNFFTALQEVFNSALNNLESFQQAEGAFQRFCTVFNNFFGNALSYRSFFSEYFLIIFIGVCIFTCIYTCNYIYIYIVNTC